MREIDIHGGGGIRKVSSNRWRMTKKKKKQLFLAGSLWKEGRKYAL